jgi:hypothetical protein
MIASKVTREVLEVAAATVGVSVDITTLNQRGTRHRVKVNSAPTAANYRTATARDGITYRVRYQDERGDAPYQRESVGYGSAGRRVHAVCWHGWRDYFRAVYQTTPDATFRTVVDTWRGSQDFEARFAASGRKNIGPPIAPVAMADACRCPDRGYFGSTPPSYVQANGIRDTLVAEPIPPTVSDSGDGETSCFERPEGVEPIRWSTYNKRMNDLLLRGGN